MIDDETFALALKAMKARYWDTYERTRGTVDNRHLAHLEALQEGLEAALVIVDTEFERRLAESNAKLEDLVDRLEALVKSKRRNLSGR